MIFKDISNFNNVNDYLPILNGCINAELVNLFLLFHDFYRSDYLQKWYKNYHLSAVLADVLIMFIGIIIVRYIYKYLISFFSIILFTLLAIAVQITHDILFYWLFSTIPSGYNYMFDFFKGYVKEVGVKAILGDSITVTMSCLFSSYFATLSFNINIITLIVSLYYVPYMIHNR